MSSTEEEIKEKKISILDEISKTQEQINILKEEFQDESLDYDILIIDDDNNTIKVLEGFFDIKK